MALLALLLVLAFTQGDDPPATSTTLVAAPTSTTAPTTTAPTTTVPTTTTAPTTAHDLTAREAEVEALVKELELAMLTAIYDGDREALQAVVGSQTLWDQVQPALEAPSEYLDARPTADDFMFTLRSIVEDTSNCLVVDAIEDATAFYRDYDEIDEWIIILWPDATAARGYKLAALWGTGTSEDMWRAACDTADRTLTP